MYKSQKIDFDTENNDIWRITAGGSIDRGPEWMDKGLISIGWGDVGDLREYLEERGEKDIKDLEEEIENADYGQKLGRVKGRLTTFHSELSQGDLVLAYRKGIFYGIGKIKSDYKFDPEILDEGHPHIREVEWLKEVVPEPIDKEELRVELRDEKYKVWAGQTLESVGGDYEKMIELLENWSGHNSNGSSNSFITSVQELLENKKQMILYGPPGTGKTYKTKNISIHLLSGWDE